MNKSTTSLKASTRIVPADSLLKFGYSPSGGIEFDSSSSVLNFSYSGSPKVDIGAFGLSVRDGEGLVVGHSAQLSIDALVPEVQVLGTTDGVDAAFAIGGFGTGTEPRLVLSKARGSIATPTAGQNGDNHGVILWVGHDGTDIANTNLAKIHAIADGSAVADSNSAGALVFSTTANGAGTVTEALRIDKLQNLVQGTVGTATAETSFDDFVIDRGTYGGISVLSTSEGGIMFGDTADNNAARI